MKSAIIINPKSASGNTIKMWRSIQNSFQRRLDSVQVMMTEYPHHATQIARKLAEEKAQMLIVMGGDGSIHEIINGLIDEKGKVIHPEMKVGILNSGRGCDFIRSLNFPTDPHEAISKFVQGETKGIDVGRVQIKRRDVFVSEFFINSFSFGLGGEVARTIQRNETMFSPTKAYFVASAVGFLRSKPFSMEYKINDGEVLKKEFLNVFVMNGRFSGGGMDWAPPARIEDGLLDLILIDKISKFRFAFVMPKVYDGTFLQAKGIHHYPIEKIWMKADSDLWVEMDGEVTQAQELDISVINKAIRFIV